MGTGPVESVFGENSVYLETLGIRRGGCLNLLVAERSSDPKVAYPDVKVQVRDLVRVVGIVVPFAPRGVGSQGKLFLSRPRGLMGTGDLCRVPPAAVRHGRGARQHSGTVPCGDCRRDIWGQYSGKIRFIEKSGVQDEGVAMWLNIVLNYPRVAYPCQSLGTRSSASCGYCCPLFPTGGGAVPGENSFHRTPGSKWAQETCAGCP